jgi:hypothetical protein
MITVDDIMVAVERISSGVTFRGMEGNESILSEDVMIALDSCRRGIAENALSLLSSGRIEDSLDIPRHVFVAAFLLGKEVGEVENARIVLAGMK